MGLFAITNNPAARVVRFPLTAELGQEIDAVFQEQFADHQRQEVVASGSPS
ncbi:hypothetical protein [Ramlibacter sp.]|uniref:hypothetical protein n=1 Tax=Ramlibacter sp. TaxID=1917967 RepID=UPI003D0CE48C